MKQLSLYDAIVASDPKLMRGRVWCHRCGFSRAVDPAKCFREGWPKCCDTTMSIDNPQERRNEKNA